MDKPASSDRLVLIRHGQASYGSADYDRLSPLGERQSRRVGERLAREQPRARAVFAGPRLRHRQTAELLVEAARAAGADYPDPVVAEDLDELPVKELVLLNGLGPDLLQSVVAAVRRWAAGELAAPGLITPEAFVARVEAAYRRVSSSAGSSVVVTSGGPIAVALLRAQELGDIGEAITKGLRLANASVTLLSPELSLVGCDPVAHLAAEEITQI
jgi:broad specificity phosphatase PhoE